MTTKAKNDYDCIASVREIRDRLSAKMARMSPEERVQWLSTRDFSDPILRRLATQSKQRKEREEPALRGPVCPAA